MADKSPRHTTSKKPTKTIKPKRAAKKLKVQQAARRDIVAAIRPHPTGQPECGPCWATTSPR
jgi:hypothetical protein